MEEASALQIVKINDHKFELDVKLLTDVLLHPEIRDRRVVVVSVAGAFRKGKSFLLGFFLRYLYAQYEEKDITDWIESGGDLQQGFSWRNGPERETTGILMWSKVFLFENENEKIAIILIDTQGVYDNESTAKDCAFIFALSTLISSVQVYNLSQNILETDLQHLQLFTEYGKLALEKSDSKPFQKLQFLIRDWQYNFKHKYGAVGGKEMLDNCLKITLQQHEELKSVRKHIKSGFNEIECFLMPHPGLKVSEEETFRGQLGDISDKFKASLNELVPLILAPKNLILKEINGEKIRAKDLIPYFKNYVEVLGGDDLPKPATVMGATAEANHMVAMSEARDYYINEMKKISDSKVLYREEEFRKKHDEFEKKSMDMFDSRKKMGSGTELTKKYRYNLHKLISESFNFYNKCNNNNIAKFEAEVKVNNLNAIEKSQGFYKKEMNELFVRHNFLQSSAFEKKEKEIMNATLNNFSTYKIDGDKGFEKYKTQLIESLISISELYKKKNDDNRIIAENAEEGEQVKILNRAKDIYCNKMESLFKSKNFMEDNDLLKMHESTKKLAEIEFENSKTSSKKHFEKYKQRLQVDISEHFEILKNRNKDKKRAYGTELEAQNIKALNVSIQLYRNKCEALFKAKNDHISLKDMKTQHEAFKKEAQNKFKSSGNSNAKNYDHCMDNLNDEITEIYKLYLRIRKDAKGCNIL